MPPRLPTRRYDRDFTWIYGPAPRAPGDPGLVPIEWDGLSLNIGDTGGGLCSVIENVEGWLDSPPLHGNDAVRSIADGAAWGPKTLGARQVTLHGAAAGPRDQLGWLRGQLATRAAARYPAPLTITDGGLNRSLTADVRGGTEQFKHVWLSRSAFRWQVTLTAADPVLYGTEWQTARLSAETGEDTGRVSPREFTWGYAVAYLPNTALLVNAGNWPAPVWALYEGDFAQSRMTEPGSGSILLAPLDAGMQIRVATASLTAEAAGGLSRASFILPGSRPMEIPAETSSRWYLFTAGRGSVTLTWRSAWV